MFEPASKSLPAIDYVSMVRAVYGDRRATLVASLSSAIAAGAAAYKTGHWALWAIAGVFVLIGAGRYFTITKFLEAQVGPTDVPAAEKWERVATFWAAFIALVSGAWCVVSFLVVGDTDTDRARWRELARMQVAFYGSTPNYAFIFEQLDHPGTTAALRERQKAGDIAGMATIITDDILRHFTIEGTWATIADGIADRYAGLATRVVNYFGAIAWTEDPQHLARWKPIAEALSHIP